MSLAILRVSVYTVDTLQRRAMKVRNGKVQAAIWMDAEVVEDLKAYQSILAAGGRRRSLGHLVEELVRPHLSNSSVAKIQKALASIADAA